MRSKDREKGSPILFGRVWSIVFLPLLFVAAGLSIPYSVLRSRLQRRRERRFQESMEHDGRVIPWAEFERELAKSEGTLIVERLSFKGPIRWWWTVENVYELSPYPLVDWLTLMGDSDFQSTRQWFGERYTAPGGQALLVIATKEEKRSISDGMGISNHVRWLEVPPSLK